MSFYEEYNSFFKELGPVGTAGYKFFDAFRINAEEKTISFHKDYEAVIEDENLLNEIRNFLKQEKKLIRTLQKDIDKKELDMKLQENGIFIPSERKYILIYADFCLE